MAVITPQSDVQLLRVPLEIDEKNQLTFSNTLTQSLYFSTLPNKVSVTDFTYQRKDGTLRFPIKYDDAIKYNYLRYRNDAYSNKWFYAFITGYEYLNDNVTAISIKTDPWQCWQFDLTYKPTFVEREHVNDDTVGVNTIDEGLELGEYVINSSDTLKPDKLTLDKEGNQIYWKMPIVFQVSKLAGGIGLSYADFDVSYNRIFSGLYYFAVTSYDSARDVINRYDQAGEGGSIVSIFLAPKEFFAGAAVFGELGYNIYIPQDSGYASLLKAATTITRPSKVNGYTPRNNKMFTFPFSYIGVDNNAGTTATYRYEDFTNATPKFNIIGALGQGCTTKLLPLNYKSYVPATDAECFTYGVTGAKYPVCAWATDYYTNWVTQNAMNVGVSAASSLLSAGANAVSGNYVSTASSLLTGVGGVMAQHYQAQHHPNQANGNTNTSDLLPCSEQYFSVKCMSVRAEVARSIDNYFDMFGYKVNRVKIPNITGRYNWNFVKTIGCYIDADIPQSDLQEIKNMFDSGVTFWHRTSTFGDYSQSNPINS